MIDTKAIRTKILDLAIQGKLTEQKAEDGTGEGLYQHILARIAETTGGRSKKHQKTIASSNQETFVIPPNWIWVRLGDVCTNIEYGSSSKSSTTGKIPVLRMCNIQNVRILYYDLVFTSDEEEIAKYSLEEGDLLFNRCNSIEHVGKTGIYRNEMPAIFAGYLVRIRPVLMSADYLNFVMQSSYYWKYCASVRSDAVGQSNINAEKIKQFRFPLPPLAEQQRIVDLLSNVVSALDGIDDRQKKYIEDIETLRVKLFKAALRGKLTKQLPEDGTAEELYQQIQLEKRELVKAKKIKKTQPLPKIEDKEIPFEIPFTWKWVRLGEIISLLSGTDLTPEGYNDTGDGIPYMTGASNIVNGHLITNRWTLTPKNIAHEGELLLVCKGSGFGKTVVCDVKEAHIARQFMSIRTIKDVEIQYVDYFLAFSIRSIREAGKGLIPGIDRDTVLRMLMPLPPLAEQRRIVDRIASLYAFL